MQILMFETPYWQSNMYLVIEKEHGIMIDPCIIANAQKLLNAHNIILDYAFLTHEHCDHITGVDWARQQGAKIICSDICAKKIQDPKLNAARYYNDSSVVQKRLRGVDVAIPENFACYADLFFNNTLYITWQQHSVEIRKTPGHSSGSVCILFDNENLFAGDTLLENEVTNTRFPSGSQQQFYNSTLPWLKTLNENTVVYPGHFKTFKLANRLAQSF